VASIRAMGALLLAALAVLAAGLALSACGNDSPSQAELDQARKEGAKQALDQQQARKQQRQIAQLKKQVKKGDGGDGGGTTTTSAVPVGGSSGGIPSGATSCADDVYAGPNTSCEFARNVAANYYGSGRSTNIDVYSPVTNKNYVMTCTGSSPTVCRGGNNASVIFQKYA